MGPDVCRAQIVGPDQVNETHGRVQRPELVLHLLASVAVGRIGDDEFHVVAAAVAHFQYCRGAERKAVQDQRHIFAKGLAQKVDPAQGVLALISVVAEVLPEARAAGGVVHGEQVKAARSVEIVQHPRRARVLRAVAVHDEGDPPPLAGRGVVVALQQLAACGRDIVKLVLLLPEIVGPLLAPGVKGIVAAPVYKRSKDRRGIALKKRAVGLH